MLSLSSSNTSSHRFLHKLDCLFWFFLMLYPVIAYLLFLKFTPYGFQIPQDTSLTISYTVPGFSSFFRYNLGIWASESNILLKCFSSIFGSSGVIPLFSNDNGVIQYFVYAATVEIFHVLFDVLIFIPRLCHKWIGGLTK